MQNKKAVVFNPRLFTIKVGIELFNNYQSGNVITYFKNI